MEYLRPKSSSEVIHEFQNLFR